MTVRVVCKSRILSSRDVEGLVVPNHAHFPGQAPICTLSTRMNRVYSFASPNAAGSRGSERLIGLLAYERGGQSRVLGRVYALLYVDFVPIHSANRQIVAHGTWTSSNTSPNTGSFFASYVKPPFTLLPCPSTIERHMPTVCPYSTTKISRSLRRKYFRPCWSDRCWILVKSTCPFLR